MKKFKYTWTEVRTADIEAQDEQEAWLMIEAGDYLDYEEFVETQNWQLEEVKDEEV
jgi:hypothetical protein